jgi:beta-1,4-mannosyl-glycoprotein beta-1,4-N-acetylglucosaminyltransferase
MDRLIDCFTFYNELDMLELRFREIYDTVDKFIIVEADKTFGGEKKPFLLDENIERFSKWSDKIIHIKINFPNIGSNPWDYERYQRNSFMQALYFLGLTDSDKVMITDVDEIPDPNTISYIKTYPLNGIYKLEMDHYFGSFRNKMSNPEKWYHPKIMNWGHLKNSTPDNCRSDFNCQWWERGGWHLSYFGGPEKISKKIGSFSHQEYNNEVIRDVNRISDKIKSNRDFLDDWRSFVNINPESNPYLPKNWRILEKYEEEYFPELYAKKDLVLGSAINIDLNSIMTFIRSLRKYNKECSISIIVENNIDEVKKSSIKKEGVNLIFTSISTFLESPINNIRYLKFFEFIKDHENEYKNVLISDVRDVYFQNDPFKGLEKNSIFFAEEDESKTIKDDDRFNSRWIRQTYGDIILEDLNNEKITCCGTVIGSYRNISAYLEFMTNEIIRFYKEKNPFFNDMLDTAIHTYIYYKRRDLLENPSMKNNGDLFGTVGITVKEFPDKITIKNNLIEVNGKIPSIIHQYDRSEWLKKFINLNSK